MKRLGILGLLVVLSACQADQIGPPSPTLQISSAAASSAEGPPSSYPFGRDTYRRSGPLRGAPVPPLVCQATTAAATYDGYLVSELDRTSLDARLEIPAGTAPFPLVALIHGYAGSKTGSGDIAAMMLGEGYAVLRYSTRGFGDSWGQVNLADLHLEIADLRSMIGRVMDDSNCNLDPTKVAITGASYGGGHSWLSLVEPSFKSPGGKDVSIVAIAPIAAWTDLFYSLLPNGRPNQSINGFGGLKLSYVNGLYASGIRRNPARPYPNYPDYFMVWHAWLNATEPNSFDPVWRSMRDGVAGYRSIYWQKTFWDNTVPKKIPIFQVQGFTDDLFPLPEAKRIHLALKSVDPNYPITSYFGDIGHPRAKNKEDEIKYVLGLIKPWLAAYLKGGAAPAPKIYAARTTPGKDFSFDVLKVDTWAQAFENPPVSKEWADVPRPLINPVTFAHGGITWDPFVMAASEQLAPYGEIPPAPDIVPTSYASFDVAPSEWGKTSLTISGQPTVTLDAFVVGHRVQLDVRLIDVFGSEQYLVTRGTSTIDVGRRLEIGQQTIVIPTYGNRWKVVEGHTLRLEISNVDSPYLTPSREPSTTTITKVRLDLPIE
jgi:ABC-2 type transport system ATP-binding protein